MEVKIDKEGVLRVKHKLRKTETFKISKGTKFSSVSIYKKPEWVSGFSNMCSDNTGIVCMDYDNVEESVVLQDYDFIQEMFGLPPGYLFQTRENSFHVVCLRKFYPVDINDILSHTRIDENYKTMPIRNPYRSWVLRISGKGNTKRPKFVKIIGVEINLDKQVSNAHFELIKKIYPKIKHPNYQNKDKLNKVKIQLYET